MLYLLLVTWIYPDQPPMSYQVEFSSEAACVSARQAVYDQAAELKRNAIKFENFKAQKSGVSSHLGSLMMAGLKLPDASATCVKR